VKVGLSAQNAIWNFRVPCDRKHLHNIYIYFLSVFHSPVVTSTFIIYIYIFYLPFTTLELLW
jgi:hypothetical protein